ncbi:MAG: hypothetical protein WAS26_16950 [Paracoccaceae bacterium]
MDLYTLARAVHILALVHWIGGVAMVTLVILPAVMRLAQAEDRLATFEAVEARFGVQARVSTLVAGLSGLWMLWETDGWRLFSDPGHWWLHLMVAVWALFTLVLFVLEPLVLHRWFHARAVAAPEAAFLLVLRLHRVLLALSAFAVAAGVLGAHGGL